MKTRSSHISKHRELQSSSKTKRSSGKDLKKRSQRSNRLTIKDSNSKDSQITPIKKLNIDKKSSKQDTQKSKTRQKINKTQRKAMPTLDKKYLNNYQPETQLQQSDKLQQSDQSAENATNQQQNQSCLEDYRLQKSEVNQSGQDQAIREEPQVFVHNYISSTSPLAPEIYLKFTEIHSHTQSGPRNLNQSEDAEFIKYRLKFKFIPRQSEEYIRHYENIGHQQDNLKRRANILFKIEQKYLDFEEVDQIKRAFKSQRRLSYCQLQSVIQKVGNQHLGDVFFNYRCQRKLLTYHNVPEFILQKYNNQKEELRNNKIQRRNSRKSKPIKSFKPDAQSKQKNSESEQSQKVKMFFEFLKANKQNITVGTSQKEGQNYSTYIKVKLRNQTIYIPLDYHSDITTRSQHSEQQNDKSQAIPKNHTQRIGFAQFNQNIPKAIFEKIKNTQVLRAQFYPSSITMQLPKYLRSSLIEDSISKRHSINVCEMLKYIKTIQTKKVELKKGSENHFYTIPHQLTFKGIVELKITDLDSLEPLHNVDLDSLEKLQLHSDVTYNLKSLRKLFHRNPLKLIKIVNQKQYLAHLVKYMYWQNFEPSQHYHYSNLKYLLEMLITPETEYINHYDQGAPLELLAKMGSLMIFKPEDTEMQTREAYDFRYNKSHEFQFGRLFSIAHNIRQLRIIQQLENQDNVEE